MYVLVEIHNVELDRDLVAPWEVVGSTIVSFDVVKLQCKWSPRYSDRKAKRGSSRACGVRRIHADARGS